VEYAFACFLYNQVSSLSGDQLIMEDYNIEVIQKKYQMVPRTLIFIERDDKILIICKNKRSSFGFGRLNGIGGHIEKGEEPFESARREIREEANIQVKNLDLSAILFIDINDVPGIEVFVFKATYLSGEIRDSNEGHLEWMTRGELLSQSNLVKDLPFLIDLVDNHIPKSMPKIVKYIYDKNEKLRIDVYSEPE
jgi:8-oxo-dGTP diphosphatase